MSAELKRRLATAYAEPQRRYHTMQHLLECLALFGEYRGLAQHPEEVEWALWFHDAIYEAQRDDNEERSAEWASAVLPGELGRRVHEMVLATRDHQANDPDTQLLVDIDLAILGAPRERFDESSAQVRAEYAHVPEAQYRTRRRAILQSFLDRPRIYGTPALHDRFEARARENLRRAVESPGFPPAR